MGCTCVEVENYKVVKEIGKNKTDISKSYLLRSITNDNEYIYKSITTMKKPKIFSIFLFC